MEQQNKRPLIKFITACPSWVFLVLAVIFYTYINTKGAAGQAIALPFALVFLLISLQKIVQEKRLAIIDLPIQARLFKGKSGSKKPSAINRGGVNQDKSDEEKLQEQYNEALLELEKKRDEKAVNLLEKIGSITMDKCVSEHILRPSNNGKPVVVSLDLEALKSLSDVRFEATVAAYYHCKGYQADVTTVPGGTLLILDKKDTDESRPVSGPAAIVQIQAGKIGQTGSRFIQALHEKKVEVGIKNSVFITRTTFSKGAVEFARENKVLLFDQRKFLKKVNELPEPLIEKIKAIAWKKY